jgi:YD repeat-containing protein
LGLPVTTVDVSRNIRSALYRSDQSTVAASIGNARPQEVVFSDFENNESYQIASSNSADSWSGKKAYQISAGGSVSKGSVTKGSSSYYRFRCRAKSTTASNITLTIQPGNATLTYPAAQSGQWLLLDQVVPVSAAANPFTFQLSSSGAIVIDDVAFYPDNAAIESVTYLPFAGKTSQTDDRGSSVFYEYDWLGKLTAVKDSDKNIREYHEYSYKAAPSSTPKSEFNCINCSALPTYLSNTLTFEAVVQPCTEENVSYQWAVDGYLHSTGPYLHFSFPDYESSHEISLTVTNTTTNNNSSSWQTIEWDSEEVPPVTPLAITVTTDMTNLTCEDRYRTITASLSGCYDQTMPISTTWYFSKNNGPWMMIVPKTQGFVSSVDNFKCIEGQTDRVAFKCMVEFYTCSYQGHMGVIAGYVNILSDTGPLPCMN